MGSLMPGWESSPPAPARSTLEEVDEPQEEREGYFRRLEKARSLRHGDGVAHQASSPPGSGKLAQASLRFLQHSATEVHRRLRDPAKHPGALLGRKSYSPTDWTSEFASLGGNKGASLARTSVDGAAARGRGGADGGGKAAARSSSLGAPMPAWWAQLDTSALNTRPPEEVVEDPASAAKASFVPQFNVTGTNLH